jgi:hypothetical protein
MLANRSLLLVKAAQRPGSVVPLSNNLLSFCRVDDDKNKKNESRRSVHTTVPVVASASADGFNEKGNALLDRFRVTAEVTVSKIFPAGFGWQTASIVAENNLGYAADSMNFALTTGIGDGLAVLAGHTAYCAAKKKLTNSDNINLTEELHTGILLGSAAFCSGTAWQPLVNALQGAELPFADVVLGTWIGCGAAFYTGLRVGRTILSSPLKYIEEPTYENSKNDASLSVAIGGATGFFVGTDTAYLPGQNIFIDALGIPDGTPELTGCAIAGSSTALGFMTTQTGLNLAYPEGKCWND